MDGKWNGIDLAYGIDSADVINMSMGVDDILRNELQFLDGLYDLLRLVAWIDDYCLTCLWTSIEIAVLLKHADRHTGDDRCLVFCCFHFGHAVWFSLWSFALLMRH